MNQKQREALEFYADRKNWFGSGWQGDRDPSPCENDRGVFARAALTVEGSVMASIRVIIDYTNYQGERRKRTIEPTRIWWGESDYHKDGPQWFLSASDIDRGVVRDFAMKDIHSWEPVDG